MIKLIDLKNRSCKYIAGEPLGKETEYCGRECVPTTSWCIKHLRVVTPKAETIINRELNKWEDRQNGIFPPIRMAAKMTDSEAESFDEDEIEPELVG
jgi:hypothetical protein